MIRVMCFTHLDTYSMENWPNQLACRPMIGDKVQAMSGKTLTICSISHAMVDTRHDRVPMLQIELHNGNITF